MKLSGKKTKTVLVVLLLAGGAAAYWLGYQLWGRHHHGAAQKAIERRDFRQASIHLEKCLEAWPRDLSVRLLAAQTARRRGDFESAKQHLEVHARQKGHANERGREYRLLFIQQGDLDDGATEFFDRTLADVPGADGHLALEAIIEGKLKLLTYARDSGMTIVEGPAAEERARAEQAVAVWRRQRQEQADQVQGLVWLGRVRLMTNTQEAAGIFRKALELDSSHFDARFHLARALADVHPREATEHLKILRVLDPTNTPLALQLASALRGLGQLGEAQKILDEILSSDANHFQALLERGKTELDALRPGEAERFLERALARSPDEPFVHLALSRCFHLQGKGAEASVHQKRHSEIEAERIRAEQTRSEAARIAWRDRLERESAPKNDK